MGFGDCIFETNQGNMLRELHPIPFVARDAMSLVTGHHTQPLMEPLVAQGDRVAQRGSKPSDRLFHSMMLGEPSTNWESNLKDVLVTAESPFRHLF